MQNATFFSHFIKKSQKSLAVIKQITIFAKYLVIFGRKKKDYLMMRVFYKRIPKWACEL